MKRLRLIPLLLLVFASTTIFAASQSAAIDASPTSWRNKVSFGLLRDVQIQDEVEFIVLLHEQADLSAASGIATKEQKGRYVHRLLTDTAQRTQADLLAQLRMAGADHRSFWITNMIWVHGDSAVLEMVASSPQVKALSGNPSHSFDAPIESDLSAAQTPSFVEPNVSTIRAPELWALGVTGQGVVIGGQDTGYDWDHPALLAQYRGWDGANANHNYNWHDAIHSGGGVCGANSSEPCDDHYHGTHTMGTMVGDDGAGNQIGVAPGAAWIGCRNMDQGVGTPTTYAECFQWFVAPTELNGENPDPSRAPHVVNNSWACPPSEGCDESETNIMQMVVENVRAAGIVVVSSAGNSGPNCNTVQYPPAIFDATFSVGATNNSDVIANFSSRGPVSIDGSNRLKPDVVAPGVSVRSSLPGAGPSYGQLSGTSMAAPHVSGLVALLISANPTLAGEVDVIEAVIATSAVPLTTDQECGGISGATRPNNTFGYGRIDAAEAYSYIHTDFDDRLYLPTMLVQ